MPISSLLGVLLLALAAFPLRSGPDALAASQAPDAETPPPRVADTVGDDGGPAASVPDDLVSRIDAYLAPYDEAGHLSGTLLVARSDTVLYERSFGMADYELGVPNTPETRFNVASLTKPMTIAVVCSLADEGKIRPDQTVGEWIEGFPRGDRITISHLLNHRAGIPHRVTTAEQETRPTTAAEMVERVEQAEPLFEPGERSVYSSAGYSVLARIIELAAGEPYGRVIEERLFRKAGMSHSVHPAGHALIPDRAPSYLSGRDGLRNAPLKDLSFLVGAGSVYSTPRDLYAMIRTLLAGGLGETAQQALLKESGLRWNGISNGYRAFADYHADTGLEVIYTGNLHTGAADRMRRDLPMLVAGEEVVPPTGLDVEVADVPDAVLRSYEGDYDNGHGTTFTVELREGDLYAGDWLLLPTSATTFFSPQDYGRVTAVRDDEGAVERLDWDWGGGVMAWRRVAP